MARSFWAAAAAANRRSQREAARRHKALLAEQRRHDAAAQARYEVEVHESYLGFITSLHRDASDPWDWQAIFRTPQPAPTRQREAAATVALTNFRPGLLDRALGREQKLVADLQQAVLLARELDDADYRQSHEQWVWFHNVAEGVLRGEHQAYAAALEHLAPFDEVEQLGASVRFKSMTPAYVEAEVLVQNAELVPLQEVSLNARGAVGRKQMPKGKYWAYYQDYVCSAALRVARELMHLLPIETAFVHLGTVARSSATGHMETQVLLSVQCTRRSLLALNFDHIDASDAIGRFPHTMNFKKTAGFSAVAPLDPTASLST